MATESIVKLDQSLRTAKTLREQALRKGDLESVQRWSRNIDTLLERRHKACPNP